MPATAGLEGHVTRVENARLIIKLGGGAEIMPWGFGTGEDLDGSSAYGRLGGTGTRSLAPLTVTQTRMRGMLSESWLRALR